MPGMRRPLVEHGTDLAYLPALTSLEYRLITSPAPGHHQDADPESCGRPAPARQTPKGTLRLVHRMRFPIALPGADPLARVDVYDFDDALPVGSIAPSNAR